MAIDLIVPHYPLDREATHLTAKAAAAQKVLAVANSSRLVANDYLVIENTGEEQAELAQIGVVDSLIKITLKSNLNFDHGQGKPVYQTPYNKMRIYYDTDEDGEFENELSGSPVNMEVDEPNTIVNDPDGSDARWYKYTYYNSTTYVETDKDDSTAIQGGTEPYLCSVEDVKRDCELDQDVKKYDELIEAKIKAATDYIGNETGVAFIKKVITDEYQDVEANTRSIFTDYTPIYSVESIYDNGQELTYNDDPSLTDYHIYTYGEIKRANSYFVPGDKMVKISYTAWRDNIPEEIKHCAIIIAGIWAGVKKRSYESAEGITEAVKVNIIPKDVMDILNKYKRWNI
jgi:hypothetical protein